MYSATSPNIQTKDEMEFRLSLLKLMTVPHSGSVGVSPSPSAQMEELSVLAPKTQKPDSRT
jgi:hypothetical protein